MHSTCRRHIAVSFAAAALWALVAFVGVVVQPSPTSAMRLPFFALLQVATSATGLATLPWLMRGFVRDQTLAYVAGYLHRESDEPAEDARHLRAVR
jgi:hypothetical protein